MKNLLLFMTAALLVFTSCDKDNGTTDGPQTRDIDVEVGGPEQPNQVFVDLSTGNQRVSDKYSWNLAFSNGNDFKVHLNSSMGAVATKFQTTDIASITSEDVEELRSRFSLDIIFATLVSGQPEPWLSETPAWVDTPDGGVARTAIDEIQATPASNFVYVINPGNAPNGDPQDWYKVRVIRASSGDKFELDYALLDDPVIKTVSIPSDPDYNFTYFSFQNDEFVNIEPPKDEWDIAFTTWTEIEAFGPSFEIPYLFKDYVIQNWAGVSSGEFIIPDGTDLVEEYENFTLGDASRVNLSPDVNNIASNWRTVASQIPGTVTGVKTDRFYIIEDGSGMLYKLAFTRMMSGSGERGYPAIRFTALQ